MARKQRKPVKVERGDKARQPGRPVKPMMRYPASLKNTMKQPRGR